MPCIFRANNSRINYFGVPTISCRIFLFKLVPPLQGRMWWRWWWAGWRRTPPATPTACRTSSTLTWSPGLCPLNVSDCNPIKKFKKFHWRTVSRICFQFIRIFPNFLNLSWNLLPTFLYNSCIVKQMLTWKGKYLILWCQKKTLIEDPRPYRIRIILPNPEKKSRI